MPSCIKDREGKGHLTPQVLIEEDVFELKKRIREVLDAK